MKVELNESVLLGALKPSEEGGVEANDIAVWCRTGTEEGVSMEGESVTNTSTGAVRGLGACCVIGGRLGGSTFCGLDVE